MALTSTHATPTTEFVIPFDTKYNVLSAFVLASVTPFVIV